MRAKLLVCGMVAVAMAIIPGGASAAVYCVPSTYAGCPGMLEPTLADALTATNADTVADQILLAAGRFAISPGATAQSGRPVNITGAGMDRTVLDGTRAAGIDPYTLSLSGAGSRVSDLTVHGMATGHGTALHLDGATAQRVRADQRDNTQSDATAVELHNGASFLDGEALSAVGGEPAITEGVLIDGGPGQTGLVTNSIVQGYHGVDTRGAGEALVSRSRVTGVENAVFALGAVNLVEDSLVGGGSIDAYANADQPAVLMTIRHVTLDAAQVQAHALSDGQAAHVVLSNSALVGGGPEFTQVVMQNGGTGTARLDADYSFYAGSDRIDQAPAPGANNVFGDGGHNVIGTDAKLLDLARGDLRPRFDSPLLDVGDPAVAGGEPAIDLAGEPRTANGRTDIGAFEYGRHAPTVLASASPRTVLVGVPVTFKVTTADPDPFEIAAVTWAFDDGATAAGDLTTHAFATPGPHTATATATDPAGLSATAAASVTVNTPLSPAKAMAPSLRFRRLKARKGIVRVPLSCPVIATDCAGTVELRLARKPKATGGAAKVVVLGRARYAIANGARKTIKVKLTRSARKRLRRARHGLNVKVLARPKGAAPKSRTVRLTGR
jgi:hypothetical protein